MTGVARKGDHPSAGAQPADLSVTEAASLVRGRKLSPVELMECVLQRIQQAEERVGAWVTLLPEQARAAAREAEKQVMAGALLGPLHGIPFGVKDVYFAAGVLTTGGSRVTADFVPDYDATAVARLKKAGAILLGKTTTAEYAFGDPPASRNPWNLEHTPGGSSSGSSAALAASMALFTLGSQTGGSLLRPASYCGLVALKPTYGRISRYGIMPVSWTLDHAGAMSRTVADAALLLQIMAGRDENDRSSLASGVPNYDSALEQNVKGRIIGVPEQPFFQTADPAVAASVRRALSLLEDMGARIVEVSLPPSFESAKAAHSLIMRSEAAAHHKAVYRQKAELFGNRIRAHIEAGQLTPAVAYLHAMRVRRVYVEEMKGLMGGIDVLATPTAPTTAPAGIGWTGSAIFNSPFSNAGLPALTVPVGFVDGLPVGMQLVGKPLDEMTLLALGHAYQSATSWHLQRPKL